jgi:hypothetical protein
MADMKPTTKHRITKSEPTTSHFKGDDVAGLKLKYVCDPVLTISVAGMKALLPHLASEELISLHEVTFREMNRRVAAWKAEDAAKSKRRTG